MLHNDPRNALARQQIAGIEDDIANGRLSMDSLMSRYDALNAAARDRGLFDLSRADQAAARRNINLVRDVVRGEIQKLGSVNPQALKSWQDGVAAFSTIHRSYGLTNWMKDQLAGPYGKYLSYPIAGALMGKAATFPSAPVVGAGLAAGAAAGYKGTQVAYRIWNSPELARYYWNTINAAQIQNRQAFVKNYLELSKKYDSKYPEDKEPTKAKEQ